MSEDMRDYVDGIVSAEQRAQSAEEEAEGMMRVAYEDALTHVGSKAAYNAACQELEADIAAGKAEFAVLMMDLNNLKVVNDTYGHEHGDVFIVGSCAVMRAALGDVPIYRVGGDEFVALLQGGHYQRRAELFDDLGCRFDESSTDSSREPWERYTASLGMADFESWRDASYNSVFIRADEAMYRYKSQRHAAEKDAGRERGE
jgi:diguanylate cyclase (GGDEF)-like protein